LAQLALYRAWRPQRFAEVVGQEQTVQALKNAVRQGRISHAYLFCGPRGTGKTSVAKILAKAVNCSGEAGGEPCNQCFSCQEITRGSFMDVIEIDAASNRGIDEIRDLREKVRMVPAQGKTKVYIIDEVHMLTTEAFNALLKTLEEPPASVVFILATTEPHKIPATILSRCQRYNFRRLTGDEITSRLRMVVADNNLDIEEKALELIARRAAGSLRDGLSILDQCQAYCSGRISREDVLNILGLVDDRFLADLFSCVLDGDIGGIITSIDRAFAEGKEAVQFLRESSMYLRDLLVAKTTGELAQLSLVTDEVRPVLLQQAGRVGVPEVLAALKKMMEVSVQLRFNESQRFVVETVFLDLATTLTPGEHAAPAATQAPAARAPREEIPWGRVLDMVKERKVTTHALLASGRLLGIKDDLVLIGYKKGFKFHREKMAEKENRDILLQVLEKILKRKVEVEFVLLGEQPENDPVVQKAIELFGADLVEIID